MGVVVLGELGGDDMLQVGHCSPVPLLACVCVASQLAGWMLSMAASALAALIRMSIRVYNHFVIATRGRKSSMNGGYQSPLTRLINCILRK